MAILLTPTYFGSISEYVALLQNDEIVFECDDNFQKQTNRNRTFIYSPNGMQMLNVPIVHKKQTHQKTRDMRIEYAEDWRKQHFKSLESAYRSSPYFEFYEDFFRDLFAKKYEFLTDLHFHSIDLALKCLQVTKSYSKTSEFFKNPEQLDGRNLANRKKDANEFELYHQVFVEKYGFLNNLSILDLLFNEGRKASDYLKRQSVTL